MLQSFQSSYAKAAGEVEQDWQHQLARATKLQEEYLDLIAQQQQRLAELTKTELRLRQQALSQSLEQFRKSYDDTFEVNAGWKCIFAKQPLFLSGA